MSRILEAKIINKTKSAELAKRCEIASTFRTRFLGLMGRTKLDDSGGLLLKPCNSIHMMFMKFEIDLVFLDRNNNVIHLISSVKPWRVSPVIPKAASVIELPTGTISSSRTEIGDNISIET